MTSKKAKAKIILQRLIDRYPEADCTLTHQSPLEMLIATVLSAQCTDKRVNIVTESLFKKYKRPIDYLAVSLEELEQDIKSTGFYHNKAKNIRLLCERLIEKYDSQVPSEMDQLVELPGVGRKTANVVLGNAFGKVSGFVVDTHVGRLSRRMGLTNENDPVKVERDLVKLFPKEEWINTSHRLIFLGREICSARKPDCEHCFLADVCKKNID